MTKDKLKDDIIRTICCLNSDISNKDRKLLIELLNSIVDYTNGENNNQNDYKPVMIDVTKLALDNIKYIVISDEQFESIINNHYCIFYDAQLIEQGLEQYIYPIMVYINKSLKVATFTIVPYADFYRIKYIDNEYRLEQVRVQHGKS